MLVLDTETSIVDGSPAPWDGARVVLTGLLLPGEGEAVCFDGIPDNLGEYLSEWELGPPQLIVGHNVKFDIQHLIVARPDLRPMLERCDYYDTQLAEYLITAQQATFASLDDLSAKYGGTQKPDEMKKFFEAGIGADQIDKQMLEEYLLGDLQNTYVVFQGQQDKIEEYGLAKLANSQMKALKSEIFMEANGFHVDTDTFYRTRDHVVSELAKAEKWFTDRFEDFEVGSSQQVTAVLFGGSYLIDGVETVRKQLKTRVKVYERKCKIPKVWPGLVEMPHWWEKTPTGKPTTSDDMLQRLVDGPVGNHTEFVKQLLNLRHWSKMHSTYIEGLQEHVRDDGIIHHKINACVTVTGRRSSSNPNMQNIPTGEDGKPIKEFFTTRFKDGYLVECDFKQLEIVGLAYRSQCSVLRQDLMNGADIHNNTGGTVFEGKMTKEQRRAVKIVNFGGSVYGGGANTVSKQAGIPKETVQACIDAFMARYTGVKEYQDNLIAEINSARNGRIIGRTEKGYPYSYAVYQTETGRRLFFREYETPEFIARRGKLVGFSPTDIKNYPVQSIATADIVPMLQGELFEMLVKENLTSDILVLSQVHDSMIFDCNSEKSRDILCAKIKELESKAVQLVQEKLGLFDFDLPLQISLGYGKNWYEASKD